MTSHLRAGACGLALVLIAWLVVSPAHAQWVPNGVPLTRSSGGEDNPVIASDGAGGAIVTWRDLRNYPTSDVDLYAQRITADGVIPPGWQADGVPVVTESAHQDWPRIASDGAGGAYVVWVDWRNYGTSQADIYIQRLTAAGTLAPGWNTNGNPVCTVAGDGDRPKVAPDGAGGAFVVWEDFRRTGSVLDRSQVDIYAQRIGPGGTIVYAWPVDGQPVCTAPMGRGAVSVMPDGVGGLFIEWADARNFGISQSDIYAVRMDENGHVASGWTSDGVPICTAPGFQNYADLAPDGAGGFIVAWLDTRAAPSGDPNPDNYYDIYAERMTASGTIAPGWLENGVPICTAPDLQQQQVVVSDGAGGAIVVWSDYRDRFVTASDLYAQRVLANGEIAPGWPMNGLPLRRLPGFELGSTAVADGAGGALVALEGNEFHLYAQHVTASGTIASGWDPDGVSLSTFPELQQRPVAVSDGKMGMIVAWIDCRSGVCDIYAQRVGSDAPTPTLISLVSMDAGPGQVVLTWSSGTGMPYSATVYRRNGNSGWRGLGAPRNDGNGLLVFEDRSVTEGRYAYRLGYAGPAGELFTVEEWVTVPRGYELKLAGFSPNPAMGEPVVALSLASREAARLELFDVSGRVVLAREVGSLGPGSHRFTIGRGGLAPGVYWLRLMQQGKSLTVKGLVAR